jgi:hypothetical protein
MQGLIDLVRKGFFPAGSKVLYAHLGGVPAINGYSYITATAKAGMAFAATAPLRR